MSSPLAVPVVGLIVERLLIAAALVRGGRRRRRRGQPPPGRRPDPARRGRCPTLIDRADFARPDAPWLVAVFTSATCAGCHDVVAAAEPLASDAVVVDEVELGRAARPARALRASTPCPRW